MMFTGTQIDLATRLKAAGIHWQPQRGQYVFDGGGKIRPSSPFQPHVYYFHDFQCFVDYFGSIEQLQENLVWLPTYEECRSLIRDQQQLTKAVCIGLKDYCELDALYGLLLTELGGS